MRDIFTLEELNDPNPEHLVPASIGGRKSSKELVNKTTNNRFGSFLDDQLADAFLMMVNALGLESRRGKTAGYTIEPKDGSSYNLASGFKPELRKASVREEWVDGKLVLSIEARSPQEAKKLIEGMQLKYGGRLDESSLKIQERNEFISDAFKISLSFGGALQLRAIGKILFEFAALALGNEVACSKDFDSVRAWIMEGVNHRDAYLSGERKDFDPLVNHDYRESIWSGLPSLSDSPFQHRVFIFGGRDIKGVWGCIEFFGHIRFSGVLSRTFSAEKFSYCHFVDPVTGVTQTKSDLVSNVDVFHVSEHAVSLEAGKEAMNALMMEIYKKHTGNVNESMAEEGVSEHFAKVGEVITPEHVDRLSRFIADRFVKQLFKINSEREITIEELNKIIKKDEGKN